MELFVPNHKFEVRYSPILDFPNVYKEILTPFVPGANNINIDDERSVNERITLSYFGDSYEIICNLNRLIIRFNALSDLKTTVEPGSIVESVFFNIFEGLSNLESFGKVNSFLCSSTYVVITEEEITSLAPKVAADYIKMDGLESLKSFKDISIMLENITVEETWSGSIHFGPYVGRNDLINRQIIIDPVHDERAKKTGYMAVTKISGTQSKITFADYKRAVWNSNNITSKLSYFQIAINGQ